MAHHYDEGDNLGEVDKRFEDWNREHDRPVKKRRHPDADNPFIHKLGGRVTIDFAVENMEEGMNLVAAMKEATGDDATEEAGQALLECLSRAQIKGIACHKK